MKRISEEERGHVLKQWRSGVHKTAAALAKALNASVASEFGRNINQRTVRNILKDEPSYRGRRWRQERADLVFVWKQWSGPDPVSQSAEEADYLLGLEAILRSELARGLYEHEAVWAKLLSRRLVSLPFAVQWLFITCCASRDVLSFEAGGTTSYTGDITFLLAVQPWAKRADGRKAKGSAIDPWKVYAESTFGFGPELPGAPTSLIQIDKMIRFMPLVNLRPSVGSRTPRAAFAVRILEVRRYEAGVRELVDLCRASDPPPWVDDLLSHWIRSSQNQVAKLQEQKED
jgi:hypothetical protein